MKLAALLLWAAASSTPQQFNLVCTGTADVIAPGVNSSSPYHRVLRIDLATSQWCADECGSVSKVAQEPGRLVLRDITKDTTHQYWREIETVDRTSGYHSIMTNNAPPGRVGRSTFSSGHCEVAPFGGFVTGKTKF